MKQPNDFVCRRNIIREFQRFEYGFGSSIFNIIRDIPSAIPDNATNGDVIKALFPSAIEDAYQPTDKVIAIRNLEGGNRKNNITPFLLDWWNAPYKAESEVEDEDSD